MPRTITHLFLGLFLIFSFLTFSYSAWGLTITQSLNVGVSAVVGGIPNPGGGGGGHSGCKFSGFAYPGATITIQEGLIKVATVQADSTGAFSVVVPDQDGHLFTLFATDVDGRRSTLLNFSTVLYSGYITDISGIRFTPTVAVDKLAVKQGDYLTIAGAALPTMPLSIDIQGFESTRFTLNAGPDGMYSITAPIMLTPGEYTVRIGYVGDSRTSKIIRVVVGTTTIFQVEATTNIPGDCNVDQRVTLADFSVLAFWFNKEKPPTCVDTNKDGVINLVDFSVLAFYWNG